MRSEVIIARTSAGSHLVLAVKCEELREAELWRHWLNECGDDLQVVCQNIAGEEEWEGISEQLKDYPPRLYQLTLVIEGSPPHIHCEAIEEV